jgi:hypothetical protein
MASSWFHSGLLGIVNGSINWMTDPIQAMLMGTTYVFDPTSQFVTAVADDETDGPTYESGFNGSGRQTLTGKAIINDEPNSRISYDADDLFYPLLDITAPANKLVAAVILYKRATSDADSILIGHIDFVDLETNGHDAILRWNPLGILRFTRI